MTHHKNICNTLYRHHLNTYTSPKPLRCWPIKRIKSVSRFSSGFLLVAVIADGPGCCSRWLVLCKCTPLVWGDSPLVTITRFEDCCILGELWDFEGERRALLCGGGLSPPSFSLSDEARTYKLTSKGCAVRNDEGVRFVTLSKNPRLLKVKAKRWLRIKMNVRSWKFSFSTRKGCYRLHSSTRTPFPSQPNRLNLVARAISLSASRSDSLRG